MSERFFEYGKVDVLIRDKTHVALEICLPISLLISTLPAFLKHGKVGDYTLNNPMSVWLPQIGQDRIKPDILKSSPRIERDVNELKNRKAEEVLKLFQELSTVTLDRSDLVPLLPLGTYALFKYRCKIGDLRLVDIDLNQISNIIGVPELRTAISNILKKIDSN